jgi:hypothetical protein
MQIYTAGLSNTCRHKLHRWNSDIAYFCRHLELAQFMWQCLQGRIASSAMRRCGWCKKRLFGVIYRFHHQGEENQIARNAFLAAVGSTSLILFALTMEAMR